MSAPRVAPTRKSSRRPVDAGAIAEEGLGEIEAAARHELPNLVTFDDIRGALHCHTDYSDGAATLEDMANAAKERGWDDYQDIDVKGKIVLAIRGALIVTVPAAFTLPDWLNYILAGGTASITFISIYTRFLAEKREVEQLVAGQHPRDPLSVPAVFTDLSPGERPAVASCGNADRPRPLADQLPDRGRLPLGDEVAAMPGLINTQMHTWQTALRSVAADWTLLRRPIILAKPSSADALPERKVRRSASAPRCC